MSSVLSSVLFWWPWVLAAAVVLFWGVGACSRLLRLRTALARAFAALAPVWQRRLTWVRAQTFAADSKAGQRLVAACNQCALALDLAGDKPYDAACIQSLALAASVLYTVWAAAVAEALPPAESSPDIGNLTWDALGHQALPLQTAFNDQVARYNHARALFPASMLAWVLRFKHAAPWLVSEG